MALYEEWLRRGQWLFERRGWLPLFGVAVLLGLICSVTATASREELSLGWSVACFLVSLVGLGIRAYTVGCAAPGTSGRNRGTQVAASLNTTGPYSVVRHPLYLGNFISWLGPVLFIRRPWPSLVFALVFWLYYERIMLAEEEFLRREFGPAFEEWAARTPAFLPDLRRWVPPATPLNLRVVLRREYSGLAQLVTIFAVLEAAEWRVATGRWWMEPFWRWTLGIGLAAALALRLLRKHTALLEDAPAR